MKILESHIIAFCIGVLAIIGIWSPLHFVIKVVYFSVLVFLSVNFVALSENKASAPDGSTSSAASKEFDSHVAKWLRGKSDNDRQSIADQVAVTWKLDKEVSLEVSKFVDIILRDFIRPWYNAVTKNEEFLRDMEEVLGNAFGALIYRGKLGLNPIIFAGDKLCDVLHRTLVTYRVVTASLGPQSPQTPSEWDAYHRAIANEFRKMGRLHPVFYWEEKQLRSHMSALNVVAQHVSRDKDSELASNFFDADRLRDCETSYLRYVSSHLTKILIVSRDDYNCRGVKHLVIELLANSVLVPVLGLFTPSTVSIWLDMLLTMLMPPDAAPVDSSLPIPASPSLMNLEMPSLSDEDVLWRIKEHAYAACLYHPMTCPNVNICAVAYNRTGMDGASPATAVISEILALPPISVSTVSPLDEDYIRCQCSAALSTLGLIYIAQEVDGSFIFMMCNYPCDVKCINSSTTVLKSVQFKSIEEITNLLSTTMELNFAPVQIRAERAASFVSDVVDSLIQAAEKSEAGDAAADDVMEKEDMACEDEVDLPRKPSHESLTPTPIDIDTDLWMEQERTVLLFDLQGAVEEFIQGNTPTAIVDRDTMYTDGDETLTILNDGVGTRSLGRILNVLEALVSHGYISEVTSSLPQLQLSASVESDNSVSAPNISVDKGIVERSVHESYFDASPSPRSNEDESRPTTTLPKNKKKSDHQRSKSLSSRIINSLTPDFLISTSTTATTATSTSSSAPANSSPSREESDSHNLSVSTDAPVDSLAYTLLNKSPLHYCSHHLTSHILSGKFFWFWQSALALESLGDRPLNNLMMRIESEERDAHCLCSVSAMSLDDRFVDACEELLSFGLLQSRSASKGSMGSVSDREDHTSIALFKANALKIILFESLRHGLLYDRLALMVEMIAGDSSGEDTGAPWKPTAFLKSAESSRALELLLPLKGRKVCFRDVEVSRPISLNIFGKFNSRRSIKDTTPKDAKGKKKEEKTNSASVLKASSQKSEKGLLSMFSDSNEDKALSTMDKEKSASASAARAPPTIESSSSLLSFVSFPSMDILGSDEVVYAPHLEFSKNADIVQVYRMKRDTADEVWAQKLGRRGGEGYMETSFLGDESNKTGSKDGAIGKSMDKILSLISTRKDSRRATQVAILDHETAHPGDAVGNIRQPLIQTMKAEKIAETMFKLSILLRDRPTTQFLESRNIWRSSQTSIHVTYLKHDKETISGAKSLVNAASSQVMIYYFAVLESPVIQCTVRSEQDPSQSKMKYVSCCPVHGYYQKTVKKVAFEQRIRKVTTKLEEETGNSNHVHEQDASTTLAQLVNRYNGRCVCDIWVMKRRFSDFEDLHKHMKEQVSSQVYHLFHMPQKHNMSVVNTSHFLGKRTHGLQEYLRDMLSVLGVSSEMLTFLSKETSIRFEDFVTTVGADANMVKIMREVYLKGSPHLPKVDEQSENHEEKEPATVPTTSLESTARAVAAEAAKVAKSKHAGKLGETPSKIDIPAAATTVPDQASMESQVVYDRVMHTMEYRAYKLIKELLEVDEMNMLRRNLVSVLRQSLRMLFSTTMTKWIAVQSKAAVSDAQTGMLLRWVRTLIWPNDGPMFTPGKNPTDEEALAMQMNNRKRAEKLLPSLLNNYIGDRQGAKALQKTFDLLSNPYILKSLIYMVIDMVLIEVFPELAGKLPGMDAMNSRNN